MYENHSVEGITRHEADKVTTDATIAYILEVINRSKKNKEKSICFVTGVPGVGKTVVGLDVAVKQSYQYDGTFNENDGAVYLSGNGPLVAVLTEALARDNYKKSREKGDDKKLSDSRREVSRRLRELYGDNLYDEAKNELKGGYKILPPDSPKIKEIEKYNRELRSALYAELDKKKNSRNLK